MPLIFLVLIFYCRVHLLFIGWNDDTYVPSLCIIFSLVDDVVPLWVYLFLTGFTSLFLLLVYHDLPFSLFFCTALDVLYVLFYLCGSGTSPCDIFIMRF